MRSRRRRRARRRASMARAFVDRLQLEVAAADRADRLVAGHEHARAGVRAAPSRATSTTLDDDRRGAPCAPASAVGAIARPVLALDARPGAPPAPRSIARRIASLVAGALQRRIDAVLAGRRDRVADREEHRERQQQRRLADRLASGGCVSSTLRVVEQAHVGSRPGSRLAVGIL